MSVNKVILVGRLGRDPELRYTPQGVAVATLSMATDRRYKDREGKAVEETQWHRVVVWAGQAESCERYLSKGRQVYVEGRLQHRSYEKEGQTKYMTEVVADAVRFLGSGAGGGAAGAGPAVSGEAAHYDDADIPF